MHTLRHPLALALASTLAVGCGGELIAPGGDDDAGPGAPDAGGGGGPSADAEACPSVYVALKPVTPIVHLLLDQSGSMTASFGGGMNRYKAMVEALVNPTTGVVARLGGQVIFGASLYTSNNGNQGGTCPLLKDVAPALDNYAAIDALLRANGPAGDTPTGESIVAVTQLLEALPADPDGEARPRLILLATDGEPDTCAVPNPQTGQPEAIAAAQAAYGKGIKTVILSVGNEVGAKHQQDMANAGAGLPIGGATNAPYYNANDPAALVAAFDAIIKGARTCQFTIDGQVDPSMASSGTVALNGMPLGYGDPNGWTIVDGNTLELLGDSCQEWLDDPAVVLEASFPCGVIIG